MRIMWFRTWLTTSQQQTTRQPGVQRPAGGRAGVLAALMYLLAPAGVQAADQFWVSLGSYSKLEGAEALVRKASGTFSQLTVIPSESPMGFVYRVVDGPLADRASADERLDRARMAGFLGAWVLIKDSSEGLPAAVVTPEPAPDPYPQSSASTSYDSRSYDASKYDSSEYGIAGSASGELLRNYSGGDAVTDPSSADYDPVAIGNQELVEEAPPGYGLHQLKRMGGEMRGGEPVESRLRELDALEPGADTPETPE